VLLDRVILVNKYRFLGLSSSILVLIILLTITGDSYVQNAFGSIEDSVDEIVDSAEEESEQAREEAEDIAEEAREDTDDEARDRDNEEDEDDTDDGDDRGNDVLSSDLDSFFDIDDKDNPPRMDRNDVSSFDLLPGSEVIVIGDPGSMDPDSVFDIDEGDEENDDGNGIIESGLNILFPTGGVGASPGDVPTVPNLGLTFDEDINNLSIGIGNEGNHSDIANGLRGTITELKSPGGTDPYAIWDPTILPIHP
jgi:vacuolar-type H+-ATPase subunit H